MKHRTALSTLKASTFSIFLAATSAFAQGVPVIDGNNLAQNIEQIQQHLADAERQLRLIEQARAQLEKLTDINTLIDGVLGSVTGLNEIGDLFNTAEDIRSRAAKITDMSGFIDSLAIGDFDGLLDSLLDGEVTMGDRMAHEGVLKTLSGAGFTPENLASLSSSENVSDGVIAQTAAANATSMTAAQLSYDEAAQSLERTAGLVGHIGSAKTIKESMDLNTRVLAENNYMLAQMWRLNAMQGLASGQNGINLAAEQAKERAFFDFSGGDK